MDLSDLGGGWLASLLGSGGSQPTSLAAPGITPPTPDSAGMPVGGTPPAAAGGPTVMGALNALGGAGPQLQKSMARPQVPPPTINFPQPRGNPTAQALSQVMARMKQPQV